VCVVCVCVVCVCVVCVCVVCVCVTQHTALPLDAFPLHRHRRLPPNVATPQHRVTLTHNKACFTRFQASAAESMISRLFWNVTQRRLAVGYRRFGTIYQSRFQGQIFQDSISLKIMQYRHLLARVNNSSAGCKLT